MPTIAAGASLTIPLLPGDTIDLDGIGTAQMVTAMPPNVDTSVKRFNVGATLGPYPIGGNLSVVADPLSPVVYDIDRPSDNSGSPPRIAGSLIVENTSYLRVGNSFDGGTGAVTVANGMARLVSDARGFTLTNVAVDGATITGYVNSQYGSRVIAAGDNISGTFGLNDLRYYGPLPAKRMQFLQNFKASMAYLAIPDANKVHAGIIVDDATDYNPEVTCLPNNAAWNGTAEFKGTGAAGRALVTTTSGASLSAPVTGDTIFIWYGQSSGTAGIIVPSVDGQTFASGSVGTDPIADSAEDTELWMLNCIVISGLTSGTHTVKLTTGNTSPVVILAWAGINSTSFSGANVYAVGIPSLRPQHWNIAPGYNGSTQATSDSKPVDFYELGGAAAWNNGMRQVCADLKAQGLNTNFVDVSGISFQNIATGDLHPLPVQHYLYAQAELAVMASLRK